ncbi:RasGTPase-activating protein [Tieghemostelium lacteum]|uniref:RasGTPase-activating protein n=1 Tax=Tieghemostelium lacteum TaxID=361077 RepID=A0A151ZJR2_TIELA|nr:RasGTPase-activating protein [Tieghemostelium lacteum]|eukprot:KYQ94186.1 RasGTPase-activating protein [Tieghemostelium lacteum]
MDRLNITLGDYQDDEEDDFLSLEDDDNNNNKDNGNVSTAKLELLQSLRDKGWGSGVMSSLSDIAYSYKDDKSSPWYEERQVIATLYRARVLLHELIETKMNQERFLSGNLCVSEIQSLLNTQKEDVETDWIAEIQELKRNMVAEIRRNHLLERDLLKLDKRIALLIKHRSNIKEMILEQSKKSKKKKDGNGDAIALDAKQLESYQNLFYLLQTEPHYLAKLVTMVQADLMEDFLDTVFLSLFGDAFSPREEFLILSLFRLAISQEMSAIKSAGDLISVESVVPKMIITYTRRKQGHEYLKQIIAPILENGVVNVPDLNLELNAVQVYQNMISEEEIKTGTKSTSNRGLGEDQILQLKAVQNILEPRIQKCKDICERFFNSIVQSLNRLPYGIRWICKQIQNIAIKNFDSKPDEIAKVIGYFVYYRFINLAIVTPETHNILNKEVSNTSIKNLVCIAKVLHNLFTMKTFQNQGSEKWLQPLNSWILSKANTVRQYFEDLVHVSDPSEYLRVDKYNELTLKLNPVVVISLGEISQTHKLLLTNLNSLKAKEKEDPLELILKSLPPPFDVVDENDREIQLTLTNRFKEHIEREISTSASLFTETKELVIQVFRAIPVQEKSSVQTDDIYQILKSAIEFGNKNQNAQLSQNAEKVLANLKKLESEGTVHGSQDFIKAIALEVINRQDIREHQRKERMRLTIALRDLRKHQAYLNDQIHHYTSYLKDVLLHYGPKDKKKSTKPIKISYKDLVKKGIIVESDIPKISQSATSFFISSDTPGVFDIEARIGPATAGTISLTLDDLLDKSASGGTVLKLENIVLDVNMTLHLLDRHFLKNIK